MKNLPLLLIGVLGSVVPAQMSGNYTIDPNGSGARNFKAPNDATADTIREFADIGVDRLVLHLGSQRPDRITTRLGELEALVNVAA